MLKTAPWNIRGKYPIKDFTNCAPNIEEKEYIAWKVNQPGVHTETFCNEHNLNTRGVYRWKKKWKNGDVLRKRGRISDINDNDLEEVADFIVKKKRTEGEVPTVDTVRVLLQEKASEAHEKRGIILMRELSEQTIMKYT
jgi:hypothetical protein